MPQSESTDKSPARTDAGRASSKRLAHLPRRLTELAAGTLLAASGISLTTLAGLGTTPISTVPYVTSLISGLTFGTTTFLLNVLFFFGQVLLLRRKLPFWNILQVPAVLVFGLCIDGAMHLFAPFVPESWLGGLAMSMAGNAVLACGIVLQLRSKTIVQPGEGIVLAISAVLRRPFGTMKIVNDVLLSLLAIGISLAWFGTVEGVREGTIVSAFLVGIFVKIIQRALSEKEAAAAPDADAPHEVKLKD